jgi:ribose 1,5-bisphosphokinase PhnN
VNLISVKFNVGSRDRLLTAIASLGLNYEMNGHEISVGQNVKIDILKGLVEYYNDTRGIVNKIKREYSMQTIAEIAKKKKWIMKKDGAKLILKRF